MSHTYLFAVNLYLPPVFLSTKEIDVYSVISNPIRPIIVIVWYIGMRR